MRVCARVLAAALMTGAIVASLVLPALMSQPPVEHRAVPAPSSSQGRTLHVPALSAPVGRPSAHRTVAAHGQPVALAAAPVAPRPKVVVFRPASVRPTTSPAVPRPRPKPVPRPAAPASPPAQPEQRELAAEAAPAPAPQTETSDDSCQSDDGHGQGHAYGHDKSNDNGVAVDDAANGNEHGNGKANGHDK